MDHMPGYMSQIIIYRIPRRKNDGSRFLDDFEKYVLRKSTVKVLIATYNKQLLTCLFISNKIIEFKLTPQIFHKHKKVVESGLLFYEWVFLYCWVQTEGVESII